MFNAMFAKFEGALHKCRRRLTAYCLLLSSSKRNILMQRAPFGAVNLAAADCSD
jgi:hypothetical protein